MRRKLTWVLFGMFILSIIVGLAAAPSLLAKPDEVTTVSTARGDVLATVVATEAANVVARTRCQVSTEIGGKVVEVAVTEGDSVRGVPEGFTLFHEIPHEPLLRALLPSELLDDGVQSSDGDENENGDGPPASVPSDPQALLPPLEQYIPGGSMLVRLDDTDALISLSDAWRAALVARAAYAESLTMLDAANEDWEDVRTLGPEEMREFEKRRYRRAIDTALDGKRRAAAATKQSALAVTRALRYWTQHWVLAPIDGIVTLVYPRRGEYVAPGQPIIDCYDPRSLYLEATIDEADIGELNIALTRARERAEASAMTSDMDDADADTDAGADDALTDEPEPIRDDLRIVRVLCTSDSFPGVEFYGFVSRVGDALRRPADASRELLVEITLGRSAPTGLKPNMSVDIEIITDERKAVLFLPAYAVFDADGTEPYVFVIQGKLLAKRPITLGLGNYARFEIASGLSDNQEVVPPQGGATLEDGVPVIRKTDGDKGDDH